MYPRSQLLFPHACVYGLRDLIDREWRDFVDHILALEESSDASLSFSLMMIRLCGCEHCDMGSYKASLGCSLCSQRAVLSVKSSRLLIGRYEQARRELEEYFDGRRAYRPEGGGALAGLTSEEGNDQRRED